MPAQIIIDVSDDGSSSLRPCALPPGIVIMHMEIMKAIILRSITEPQEQPRVLPASRLPGLNGS